jgi:hypothetical protein
MSRLITLLLIPAAVAAQDCVMQEKTVGRQNVVIAERSEIRRDIVPWSNNQMKCVVSFKARIDNSWHLATGEYIWDGDTPPGQACGAAVKMAEKDLTAKVKPSTIISEEVLVCRDDADKAARRFSKIGDVIDITQVRVHPNYQKRFNYNGTECKWFLDSVWTGKDIREYQGIACKVEPTKWVVVDKF